MRHGLFILFLLAFSAAAAENGPANLQLRFPQNETLRYTWTMKSLSQTSGREMGKPFTLTKNSEVAMLLLLKGLPLKGVNAGVSLRLQDYAYSEKDSIGPDVTAELTAGKGHIKYLENGKVVLDSENDIGSDKLPEFQQHIKDLESSEMRAVLDPAGRQIEMKSDNALTEDSLKKMARGIFPILAGKEVKVGESWEDSFEMPELGDFKLARPALVRSKMTFVKWVEKDHTPLAEIEVVSAWEKKVLKGENDKGLLVEFSEINGHGIGTCHFDPAQGRFVDGDMATETKYRLDGELNGETTGLDVSSKTSFAFTLKK